MIQPLRGWENTKDNLVANILEVPPGQLVRFYMGKKVKSLSLVCSPGKTFPDQYNET